MKFLKDYNFESHYYLRKANEVGDVLCRKSPYISSLMVQEKKHLKIFFFFNY